MELSPVAGAPAEITTSSDALLRPSPRLMLTPAWTPALTARPMIAISLGFVGFTVTRRVEALPVETPIGEVVLGLPSGLVTVTVARRALPTVRGVDIEP